ncbi:hypothetical protein ACWEKM_37595 [Streptomyces sp. NPDC004752]
MDRRALVTAGTGGIGTETAVGLAAAGYAVTVVGRDVVRGGCDVVRGGSAVERINAVGTAAEARVHTANESVSPEELERLAVAEALFLRNCAGRPASPRPGRSP